jgi:hypothetical protein
MSVLLDEGTFHEFHGQDAIHQGTRQLWDGLRSFVRSNTIHSIEAIHHERYATLRPVDILITYILTMSRLILMPLGLHAARNREEPDLLVDGHRLMEWIEGQGYLGSLPIWMAIGCWLWWVSCDWVRRRLRLWSISSQQVHISSIR